MNNNLTFIVLAFIFGLVFSGAAQEFYYTIPQDQGNERYYLDSYYPNHDPSAYWTYPFIPVKCAVQAAKERLRVDKYNNPNSVFWKVQEAKERLWTVKSTCYGCWPDYGWMERGRSWESKY